MKPQPSSGPAPRSGCPPAGSWAVGERHVADRSRRKAITEPQSRGQGRACGLHLARDSIPPWAPRGGRPAHVAAGRFASHEATERTTAWKTDTSPPGALRCGRSSSPRVRTRKSSTRSSRGANRSAAPRMAAAGGMLAERARSRRGNSAELGEGRLEAFLSSFLDSHPPTPGRRPASSGHGCVILVVAGLRVS